MLQPYSRSLVNCSPLPLQCFASAHSVHIRTSLVLLNINCSSDNSRTYQINFNNKPDSGNMAANEATQSLDKKEKLERENPSFSHLKCLADKPQHKSSLWIW